MGKLSPAHVVTFSSYWYMRGEPQTAVSDVRDRQSVNLTNGVGRSQERRSPLGVATTLSVSPSPGAQLGLPSAVVDCRSPTPSIASASGMTSAMRRRPRRVALWCSSDFR